jgi:hypothetical protein
MNITIASTTYNVSDWNNTWKFIVSWEWISIPWQAWHDTLIFKNSKRKTVESFHRALWDFLNEIKTHEENHPAFTDPQYMSD